jgi:hypothetical protein
MNRRLFSAAEGTGKDRHCGVQGRTVSRTCECLRFVRRNSTQMLQVALVSDQHYDNVCVGMVSQLLEPSSYVDICHMFGDIIYEQCADRPTVVAVQSGFSQLG